jgi:hypothetical protein
MEVEKDNNKMQASIAVQGNPAAILQGLPGLISPAAVQTWRYEESGGGRLAGITVTLMAW